MARRGIALHFDDSPIGDIEREALVEGLPLWLAERRGWLYLATNPSWPGCFKLGCTRKSVERRLIVLSGAGTAMQWSLVRSWPAYDAHGLEALAHSACAEWKWELGAEMFKAPADVLERAVNQAIQGDRASLESHLRGIFIPGQLEELLDAEHGTNSTVSSYTS